jgi:2-oxoisovalerate dehydrogenase E1 component
MQFNRKALTNAQLINFYHELLYPRLIEEKMLVLLRQGKISKWFSGIGQEAISVGATLALESDEWIMPLHRNLGVFTSRKMPLHKLFMQWQGNHEGYSKGRERSFHVGTKEHFICGMISHLGPQLAVADGAGLANQLQQKHKVALAFTGDGGTSEGDFHEALNVAAVWNLPVIFIIENNGYGLSTPINEQYRCKNLVDKAIGYGMEGVQIDGNNILEVYDTISGVRKYCIEQQKPYLIECMTFRMRGHEEASGTKYVPKELFDIWAEKDPIKNYEEYLLNEQILTPSAIEDIRHNMKLAIEEELQIAYQAAPMVANTREELADVYAPAPPVEEPSENMRNNSATTEKPHRLIDALKDGLDLAMQKHDKLILMGQDIAEYGGAFKITEGLLEKYGKNRVRNTPLCESAIIGTALGLSLEGFKSMVEMQFADFVSVGFNQIVNNLAKIHYRWNQNADVVVRMPTGAGVGAGPFHSQSNEAWFTHVPGLKVVYPATPFDAKGLLLASFNDPNPILFFEHKALYRSVTGYVPNEYYEIPIGKARVAQSGSDLSIITYGAGVHWALQYCAEHTDSSIEIIDLRTLLPLDYDSIRNTVLKTGKVLVLHEDTLTGGIGAEISAWITEHCFEHLDAPVMRCASLDTPVPFNTTLEQNFLAHARLAETIEKLLNY